MSRPRSSAQKDDRPAVGAGQVIEVLGRTQMENKVAPIPDRKLIRHRRIEIALMVVSATAVLAIAAGITAYSTADPNPDGVMLAAFLGGMAMLAVVGCISGVLGCLDDIRRARR